MAPKQDSNARQAQRRAAVTQLNILAADMSVRKVPVKAGTTQVAVLVRELDRKCTSEELSARLRDSITLYLDNGGTLPDRLRPVSDTASPTTSPLQRHRLWRKASDCALRHSC